MKDYISLGPTPCDEECAQVGDNDYSLKSKEECRKYKQLLLNKFGEPPEGARFLIKNFSHDYGSYSEVVISFDSDNREALSFAIEVENNLPSKWD